MASTIGIQINFEGKSPIVTGDKKLTLMGLSQLLDALNHGSRYKQGQSYVQVRSAVVPATGTVTAALVQAADTVTVNGTVLTAAQRRARATVTFATAIAGNTITVNGAVFTAVNGAVTPGAATFDISGGNTTGAASFVTQLAAYSDPRVSGVISSISAAAVVTLFAVAQGTTGNAYTLASSGATLTVSGATFSGGSAIAVNTFDMGGSNTTTAAALAAAIGATTTAALQQFTATSALAVATITANMGGPGGNASTLASSNGGRLAVSGATFTGGTSGNATRWTF